MNEVNLISSINFHLLEACNARCGFCFAKYGHSTAMILLHEAKQIIEQVAAAGIQKITFAGGEPLLYPYLNQLIVHAKQLGLTTMLVTNGMKLTPLLLDKLVGQLDWVGISIDSFDAKTNLAIGRAEAGYHPMSSDHYMALMWHVKERGLGLKVNTVVNALNADEYMAYVISAIQPQRWKIMKAIFNSGTNDNAKRLFAVTDEQFADFVLNNQILEPQIKVVAESEEYMRGSYLMIDPLGRLYDNVNGHHRFSSKILEVGIEQALRQVEFDVDKFKARNGIYDWGLPSLLKSSPYKI